LGDILAWCQYHVLIQQKNNGNKNGNNDDNKEMSNSKLKHWQHQQQKSIVSCSVRPTLNLYMDVICSQPPRIAQEQCSNAALKCGGSQVFFMYVCMNIVFSAALSYCQQTSARMIFKIADTKTETAQTNKKKTITNNGLD
jgi:uncharacterized membrane protein